MGGGRSAPDIPGGELPLPIPSTFNQLRLITQLHLYLDEEAMKALMISKTDHCKHSVCGASLKVDPETPEGSEHG